MHSRVPPLRRTQERGTHILGRSNMKIETERVGHPPKGGIPNSGPLETLTLLFSSRGAPLTVKRMPNGLQALLRRRSFAFSRLQAGAGNSGNGAAIGVNAFDDVGVVKINQWARSG